MHLFKSQIIINQKLRNLKVILPMRTARHNDTWDLLEKCHLQEEWSRLRMSFAFEISWSDSAPNTAMQADVIRKYLAVEILSNTMGIQSRNRISFSRWSRHSGRSVSNESRLNQCSLRLLLCWCVTGILSLSRLTMDNKSQPSESEILWMWRKFPRMDWASWGDET
jgi:hypothetical protein